MRRLGEHNLSKTAIDPELANFLLHAGVGSVGGHVAGNVARVAAGKFAPNLFPRMAQTGVQHGFERKRLAPSFENFLSSGVMPESVAEYQIGRQAGRVGRVTQRALDTENPDLRFQRLGRMKKLMDKSIPSKNPLSDEMSKAIGSRLGELAPGQVESEMAKRMQSTPLGRTGKTIAEDIGYRLSGSTSSPTTKAFKVPKFLTTHENAKPSLAGRAAGIGAMAAGVAAEPGYAGHIGINKFRHWFGGTAYGKRTMNNAANKGFKGERTHTAVRAVRDLAVSPFLSELEDVGRATNIANPMPGGVMSRLMQPDTRLGRAKQKVWNMGSGAAKAVRGVAGKVRNAMPWRRAG